MNDTQGENQTSQATTNEEQSEAGTRANETERVGQSGESQSGEAGQVATDAEDASDTDVLIIEFDQLDTDLVEFDTLVEQDIITVDSDGDDDIREMHAQRDTARDMRVQFEASDEESRSRLRSAFQGAIDDLREAWHRMRTRIEDRRRAKGPEGTEAHP